MSASNGQLLEENGGKQERLLIELQIYQRMYDILRKTIIEIIRSLSGKRNGHLLIIRGQLEQALEMAEETYRLYGAQDL